MPSTKKERIESVNVLTKDLEKTQGLVVAGYVGVKTPELNELRDKLRPIKGRCMIVKNTLAKIALKNRGIAGMEGFFEGQSALVLQNGDTVASLKVLVDFEKGHSNLKIRAGYLNGHVMKAAEIKIMAALPTKNVLMAQMLRGMQTPVSKLQSVMSAPLRYLASAMDKVAKSREVKS
jgi:large subunit ribosomal protein L10